MFSAWTGLISRPTMDIDLLGNIESSIDLIVAVFKEACETEVEKDGIVFHKDTVTATRITEDADYKGIRVLLRGTLSSIRLFLQTDIGFGDVIIPKPGRVKYPVLLDFPQPELNEYTMESNVKDDTKQTQWQGFIKKTKLTDAPVSFEDVAGGIKIFLQPIVVSMINQQTFRLFWAAPRPWHI